MSKLNRKGFTLIELLAVITIMGILMVVAIPSISRTIENTRRDSLLDTAKQYVNGVKTMWISDSLECPETAGGTTYTLASALPDGDYYVNIDSASVAAGSGGAGTTLPIILESGGTSSWSNKPLKGYVKVSVSGSGTGTMKQKYYIAVADGTHGVNDSEGMSTEYLSLKRGNIKLTGVSLAPKTASAVKLCKEV